MDKQSGIGYMGCRHCGGLGETPDFNAGEVLRAEREAAGISRATVATAMDISEAYLGDMERGSRLWSSERVAQFREALVAIREDNDGTN